MSPLKVGRITNHVHINANLPDMYVRNDNKMLINRHLRQAKQHIIFYVYATIWQNIYISLYGCWQMENWNNS